MEQENQIPIQLVMDELYSKIAQDAGNIATLTAINKHLQIQIHELNKEILDLKDVNVELKKKG